MLTRRYRKLLRNAKDALLATFLFGLTASMAPGQVVELPTGEIDRRGNPIATDKNPGSKSTQSDRTPAETPQQSSLESSDAAPTGQAPIIDPNPNQAPRSSSDAPEPQKPESAAAQATDQINLDPNAPIEDLIPPAEPPPAVAADFGAGRQRGLGATSGSFSAAPTMIGDIFGGSFSTFGGFQTVRFQQYGVGTLLSGDDGLSNSTIAFEFGQDTTPNDIITTGLGADRNLPIPDGHADTFAILEPVPPSDAPTSPGPGFVFDGGTAVYTGNTTDTTAQAGIYTDGSIWYIDYSYTETIPGGENGRPVPGPGVAARRIKLSENFSPAVRDRCFATYNFFNDAFGGLGDVSRYTLGFEKILVEELFSIETRMLMAGTYGSTQDLQLNEARDFEFGNCALIGKAVLLQTENFLWSGGLGVTLPTADDTRIKQGGQDVLVVKNRTVHLLPFSAMLFRLSRNSAFQAYMQLDVAANSDPIFANLTGGPLPLIGKFNDSTLMNIDLAFSHVLFRNQNRGKLKQLIGNAELHYTGTMQESDVVTNGSLTYSNLKRNFNIVNATGGCHFVFCNNVVVTPAMSIPLRDGLDQQFDYEAIVQLNYIH